MTFCCTTLLIVREGRLKEVKHPANSGILQWGHSMLNEQVFFQNYITCFLL